MTPPRSDPEKTRETPRPTPRVPKPLTEEQRANVREVLDRIAVARNIRVMESAGMVHYRSSLLRLDYQIANVAYTTDVELASQLDNLIDVLRAARRQLPGGQR